MYSDGCNIYTSDEAWLQGEPGPKTTNKTNLTSGARNLSKPYKNENETKR